MFAPLGRVLTKMSEEINAGTAQYHWEDDGEEFHLMRNGVEVAGVSHGFVNSQPELKAAIEECFSGAVPN